jgi:precorrin-2 dehydrogenase/sirohydrochlorin ferrochelatase
MKKRFPDKEFMPIALDVGTQKIVLIGGGKIALQKVEVLSVYAHNLFVVAREICDEIKEKGVPYIEKSYESSDVDDAFVVYACTDIRTLNKQIWEDCKQRKILINVVDDPALCDFVTPAIHRRGYVSIAVTSNAQSVMESIKVRNEIQEKITYDPPTNL